MKAALASLSRLAWKPIEERHYVAVRVTFGLVLLIHILALWPYRLTLFSDAGLLPTDADNTGRYLSLFAFLRTAPGISAYFAFSGVAAVGLILGIVPRLSALVAFVWLVSYQQHLSFVGFGADVVMRVFGFILLLSPLGSRSLFAKPAESPVQAPQYGLVLFRLQLAVIYFDTAVAKLFSESWLNGEAISKFLLSVYSIFPSAVFLEWLWLTKLLTYGTLAYEFALPFLLFYPKTRGLAILSGILFHVVIGIASPFILLFSLAMLPGYVAFWDDTARKQLAFFKATRPSPPG